MFFHFCDIDAVFCGLTDAATVSQYFLLYLNCLIRPQCGSMPSR